MYTLIEKNKMFLKHIKIILPFIKLIYGMSFSGNKYHKYHWETSKKIEIKNIFIL